MTLCMKCTCILHNVQCIYTCTCTCTCTCNMYTVYMYMHCYTTQSFVCTDAHNLDLWCACMHNTCSVRCLHVHLHIHVHCICIYMYSTCTCTMYMYIVPATSAQEECVLAVAPAESSTFTSTQRGCSLTSASNSAPVSLVTTSTGTGGHCSPPPPPPLPPPSLTLFSGSLSVLSVLTRMIACAAGMLERVAQKYDKLSSFLSWWRRMCEYVVSEVVKATQSIARADWLKAAQEWWNLFVSCGLPFSPVTLTCSSPTVHVHVQCT